MDVKSLICLYFENVQKKCALCYAIAIANQQSDDVVNREQSKLGYLQHLFLSFLSAYNHLTIFMSKRHNTIQHRVINSPRNFFFNIELAG